MVNVKINVNPTPYNETLFVGNQFLLTLVLKWNLILTIIPMTTETTPKLHIEFQ